MLSSLSLNTKHTESAKQSTPLSLLVLGHVLGSFFVSGSLPFAEKIQTPHPVEALITPESLFVDKYHNSLGIWEELDRRHTVLTEQNHHIRDLKPETDMGSRRRKAEWLTIHYAGDFPEGFPNMVPETVPIRDPDRSELIDYQTRGAEEKLLDEAFAQTREKESANIAMSLQKANFEIHYNAKRFVTSRVERNKAIEQGNFEEAHEWTKKAANALDRNFELQIFYLLNRAPLPNPYKTQEYSDVMNEFYKVLERHQISDLTRKFRASNLNEKDAKRAAEVALGAEPELDWKALERLDNVDFERSFQFFENWKVLSHDTDLRDVVDKN